MNVAVETLDDKRASEKVTVTTLSLYTPVAPLVGEEVEIVGVPIVISPRL
jgi:hypothetical protein